MPAPLVPATPAFEADGTPYSPLFDDIFHSREGGPAQARHVFLGGNGLPGRWKNKSRFTILETGFGIGLNFLAAWSAWRDDPDGPAKLHFVSIEKHPFSATDLARLHARHPEFAALSSELCAAWPMLVPGFHRLEFEQGNVVLTLCLGDVATVLPQLRLSADALFLDGFAPARNPDMWSSSALKLVGKLAAQNATFATYTAAASVRDALGAAGFEVRKVPGYASKRDMLCGRYMRPGSAPAAPSQRRALVIGAGLAGGAVCERLAARGWELDLVERAPGPAQEASGNHAGAFHPLVTIDDNVMAQLSRAAFCHALRQWPTLDGVSWSRCGVLQMPRTEEESRGQSKALAALGYPPSYASLVSRDEAAAKAGIEVTEGGVWFPSGGWMQPATLVRAFLEKAKPRLHFGTHVDRLERSSQGWLARDVAGNPIAEAPIVVLANADDALRLAPSTFATVRRVRGQVSYLPAAKVPPIRAVLLRGGMVLPATQGVAVTGASYDVEDNDPNPRLDSHVGNLERLARILPECIGQLDPLTLEGRVGFRAVTRDRLPMVGSLSDDPQSAGLQGAFAYGSRGILWCGLMAEVLASRLEGDPLPIEARLAKAVDAGRFERRARPG